MFIELVDMVIVKQLLAKGIEYKFHIPFENCGSK